MTKDIISDDGVQAVTLQKKVPDTFSESTQSSGNGQASYLLWYVRNSRIQDALTKQGMESQSSDGFFHPADWDVAILYGTGDSYAPERALKDSDYAYRQGARSVKIVPIPVGRGHTLEQEIEEIWTEESLLLAYDKQPFYVYDARLDPDRDGNDHSQDKDMVIRADKVNSKKVLWLWPNRVPFGFITIFAGRTGLGKSFVACDIVARLTRGDHWPDGKGEPAKKGHALIISEDPHDYVLKPRLDALKADSTKVHFMTWEAMATYTLADTGMLNRLWHATEGPDLIVIDPPNNFLGGIDEHRNADVRGVLMLLVKWLVERQKPVAMILITQVTKGGKEVEAVNRIIGSVAWTATPRIAHTFALDKENPDQSLFCCPKNNLGPLPKTLAYQITPTEEFAELKWLGESEKTADEAMNGRKAEPRSVSAKAFLIDMFRMQQEWPSNEILEKGQEKGISRNALFEAKKDLDVCAVKRGKNWSWWVPLDWEHLREENDDSQAPF